MPAVLHQIENRAGDAPAEDWRAIAATLRRYVRGRTSRTDVVEDVVQETLSRLVQQGRVQKLLSVYALGFRIAANLLIDHHRRDSRYVAESGEETASLAPSPHRVLAGRQEVAILKEALAAMPPLRRDVLVRRRLHGQSCAAIAKELGLSAKAVEKHITRGLANLHKAMPGDTAGREAVR
ncbi:RNA polymerase sigma-70 factor (ECF subfamily) [Sphingomonas sp. BK036]|uniref:RNA polymerase sigma factor n=1 Tax=Sphingomonas sp. BK036 TaxID=2512122 RepID=UPI00102A5AFA|nr:RNA polymerase sigma factor [Sphingomonas sp. BK036]RZT53154.1 RNA polymerase sigma-70 factor (ECF subfamily) [Sphingomonas sp. BK036]